MSDSETTEITASQLDNRAELVAKEVVDKHGNVGSAMIKAGYSPQYAKNPQYLTKTKKFQDALQKLLPKETEDVGILKAAYTAKRKETIDWSTLHSYLETSLKLKGYLDKDKDNNQTQIAIVVER